MKYGDEGCAADDDDEDDYVLIVWMITEILVDIFDSECNNGYEL